MLRGDHDGVGMIDPSVAITQRHGSLASGNNPSSWRVLRTARASAGGRREWDRHELRRFIARIAEGYSPDRRPQRGQVAGADAASDIVRCLPSMLITAQVVASKPFDEWS